MTESRARFSVIIFFAKRDSHDVHLYIEIHFIIRYNDFKACLKIQTHRRAIFEKAVSRQEKMEKQMELETQRLTIRDLLAEDAVPFAEMAADGSLKDVQGYQ